MEHLSSSVTAGTLDKLRELAGGKKRFGSYLSAAIAWLWEHRETLQGRELHEFVPIRRVEADSAEMVQMQKQIEQQQQQIAQLGESMRLLGKFLEATSPQVVGSTERQPA